TSGTSTITVTVSDGQSANNPFSRTFSVIVNNPPTLNALSNLSVSQDAPTQAVALSGITAGAASEAQSLAITATSSNPSVVPNPTITYNSPAGTGTLNFKPVAAATGTAVITVTVNDNQGGNNTFSRSFTVTVSPSANNPPTLAAISNVAVAQ